MLSLAFIGLVAIFAGCRAHPVTPAARPAAFTGIQAVDLSTPNSPRFMTDGLHLNVARNGWTQCVLSLDCGQLPPRTLLQLPTFADVGQSAFQILPAYVDINEGAAVRQTGDLGGRAKSAPRVLLPLPTHDGVVDLAALREPAEPANPNHHPLQGSVLIWIDVYIPTAMAPGDLKGTFHLINGDSKQSIGGLPVQLTVENLTLSGQPHLHVAAPLEWSTLSALFPQIFQPVPARLLNKSDPRQAVLLKIIDDYMQLAHANKVDLYVPQFQPIVKWPLDAAPTVDWTGFDSVVSGYLTGTAFADGVPTGFWPLPAADSLQGFDLATQVQYWHQIAAHFDQHHWLDRCPVIMGNETARPVNEAGSILISAEARQILASHQRITALLPFRDDQTQLVSPGNASGITLQSTGRLLTLSPGLVYTDAAKPWPTGAALPRRWIDAAAKNGVLATTGIADEQTVRTLAWLAFARDTSLVLCDHSLPPTPYADHPVAADQLLLLYPGQWYGVDHPLATIQLKWMRQTEQDYEYLTLAKKPDNLQTALHLCRLITKPVELQTNQPTLPAYDLLAGTTDPHASEEARLLLAGRLQRSPGQATATDQVELQTVRWFHARQHPTLLAASNQWQWHTDTASDIQPGSGNWLDAAVHVDLYNPAEGTAEGSVLQWNASDSAGWEPHPKPTELDPLGQFQVRQVTARARYNLDRTTDESRQPIELHFIDGFTGQSVICKVLIPVAKSSRLSQFPEIDGSLADWFPADAIQLNQPLARMLNRPALQAQELQLADVPSSIYTGWSNDQFYLAFRLAGISAADLRSTRNFVQYDHGRAWGEDLCELLIQPIYIDNTLGPTLHVVCKPGGSWVEQQPLNDTTWQPFEAAGVRYAAGVVDNIWRGEVAIPWKAIAAAGRGRPGLLRFNFIQHQQSTGQSASWAGPIDQSRDGNLMGLLQLKEP